jgi:hypothetical protein
MHWLALALARPTPSLGEASLPASLAPVPVIAPRILLDEMALEVCHLAIDPLRVGPFPEPSPPVVLWSVPLR